MENSEGIITSDKFCCLWYCTTCQQVLAFKIRPSCFFTNDQNSLMETVVYLSCILSWRRDSFFFFFHHLLRMFWQKYKQFFCFCGLAYSCIFIYQFSGEKKKQTLKWFIKRNTTCLPTSLKVSCGSLQWCDILEGHNICLNLRAFLNITYQVFSIYNTVQKNFVRMAICALCLCP